MKKLADVISHSLARVLNDKAKHVQTLSKHWSQIVGPQLSEFSMPIKLIEVRAEVKTWILVIGVASSVVGTELSYSKALLLSRIETVLGKDKVVDIKLKVTDWVQSKSGITAE